MTVIGPAALRRRFTHHPPASGQVVTAHETVRALCHDLAAALNELLPPSDEAKLALDHVDLACMHANAAVARHANGGER